MTITYYAIASVAAVIILLIGAFIVSLSTDKDNRIVGCYILIIGLAGVIWGGVNSRIVATEVIPEYTGPVQNITIGRIVSFENNQLTIVEDAAQSNTTTFLVPDEITQQMRNREIIATDAKQIVAVTTVNNTVTEVAIALSGEPSVSIRTVEGAQTRGGTALWWFAILAIVVIAILDIIAYNITCKPNVKVFAVSVVVAVIVCLFLFISEIISTVSPEIAKRGNNILEPYISYSYRGVIESIDGRIITLATKASTTVDLRISKDTANTLRSDDKIGIHSNTEYDNILLLFN